MSPKAQWDVVRARAAKPSRDRTTHGPAKAGHYGFDNAFLPCRRSEDQKSSLELLLSYWNCALG